jgi:pyruvate dehydrogenase E1 component alpha subunit
MVIAFVWWNINYQNFIMNKKLDLYKKILFIRLIEEEIANEYKLNNMRCPVHLSIGQESCAVGVCQNLSKKDIVFSNHRSHAHYIAKGGNVQKMIDEMHGKVTGCVGGRGGSMHLQDLSVNFYASIPIVSSAIGLATGTAFTQKRKNLKSITTVFIGDGSMEEGIVHESLNFSSINNLPLLYVCENNFYSIYTHVNQRQPSDDMTRFAKANNINYLRIRGDDLYKVLKATSYAVKFIKQKNKPFFLQLDTYRHREHCGPNIDDYKNYRKKDELKKWLLLDPVLKFKNKLFKDKILNIHLDKKIKNEITVNIKNIFKNSLKAKLPFYRTASNFVYAK